MKSKLAEQGIKGNKYRDYKLYRPKDVIIADIKAFVFSVFEAFVDNTTAIKDYVESHDENKASKFRNVKGGNLLFRPLALTEYFEAAVILFQRGEGIAYADVFERLNETVLDISQEPWLGLIWDGEKIINRVAKTVIRMMLVSMANATVLTPKERDKLSKDYASSLNISPEDSSTLINKVSKSTCA